MSKNHAPSFHFHELGSAFAQGLIAFIRKDKSWGISNWSKQDVRELLAPLSRHVRGDGVGRTRRASWSG